MRSRSMASYFYHHFAWALLDKDVNMTRDRSWVAASIASAYKSNTCIHSHPSTLFQRRNTESTSLLIILPSTLAFVAWMLYIRRMWTASEIHIVKEPMTNSRVDVPDVCPTTNLIVACVLMLLTLLNINGKEVSPQLRTPVWFCAVK